MSVLLLPPIFQFFDNNGDPLANGFVYTYAAGTTTLQATYTDASGTTKAPNPVPLNAAGRPTSGSGAIWGEGAYKFIVKDANGMQVGDVLDNVTSFTGLAAASNAYAETFSGNGSQTVFTTSTNLGTDPKALLVSVSNGLQEIAQNGSFTTDTLWTKGAGWTIATGNAIATGAISTAISQVPVLTIVAGQAYAVTYTITRSAGGLIPSIGGQNGVERTASGTYREIIIAASTTPIAFTGNGFTGTLDSVSVTEAVSENMALLSSNAYTINGTTLTFASAPASGTNNIDVRQPSSLVGAASSAAALAQTYAANALTSQTAAAVSASSAAAYAAAKNQWTFFPSTTMSDPATGNLRFNNATLSSVTEIAISDLSSNVGNPDLSAWVATWDDAGGTNRGSIFIFKDNSNFAIYNINAALTDNGTWSLVPVTYVASSGSFSSSDSILIGFAASGSTLITGGISALTGDVTASGSGSVVATIAAGAVTQTKLASTLRSNFNDVQGFRLTLTSGVPVTTSDVTGANTLYCTPYKGNSIALYDGTNWNIRQSGEFSVPVTGGTTDLPYDVFCYDAAGTPTLEFTAWTNSTTRATALAYQDGILVKSGVATRRYLGTVVCTSATTLEDSLLKRYVWNYYHRACRIMVRQETTSSWTYATATIRQANGSASNQLSYVQGVSEDLVCAEVRASAGNAGGSNCIGWVGIGVDSTSVSVATSTTPTHLVTGTAPGVPVIASYEGTPAAGRHILTWLEQQVSGSGGTTTWYGTNSQAQAGIFGKIWA